MIENTIDKMLEDTEYFFNEMNLNYDNFISSVKLILKKNKRKEIIKRQRNRQIELMKRRKKIWNRQR